MLYIDQRLGQPESNKYYDFHYFKTIHFIKMKTENLCTGYITLFASFLFNNVVIESVKL